VDASHFVAKRIPFGPIIVHFGSNDSRLARLKAGERRKIFVYPHRAQKTAAAFSSARAAGKTESDKNFSETVSFRELRRILL
jgi:hypothetical protein